LQSYFEQTRFACVIRIDATYIETTKHKFIPNVSGSDGE